jgi:predicted phosphodiesterase
MRIAVLTDIHANLVALNTVIEDIDAWQPDQVIVAGDIINRGPRPAECLSLIRARQRTRGWLTVRGNHEDYVLAQAQPDAPRSGPASEVHRASRWTMEKLGAQTPLLMSMPFQQDLYDPAGRLVRIVHASMLGNRIGIYPETTDDELAYKIGILTSDESKVAIAPALFCVGHTHRPLIRTLKDCLVVNAGSAGLAFDGDTRASYARLTWRDKGWDAEIIRLKYDIHAAEQDFIDSGYLSEAGPLVQLVRIELNEARSMLFGWALRFQERVMAGEISMEQSVQAYLMR